MEEKAIYKIGLEGYGLDTFIEGKVAGIIAGVTNDPDAYRSPITITTETKGWWIFKRKRITSIAYRFEGTLAEYERVVDLASHIYGRDAMRDFNVFGGKLK